MSTAQPIDTSVKIPSAVLAAAARADELVNAMNPQEEGVTPEGNTPAPAEGQQPPMDTRQETQPATTPATAPAAEGDVDWEHRYKSLHGRFTRQEASLKTMTDRVRSMEQILATMQATTPAAPSGATSGAPDEEPERLITPEEVNDYGADFLNVVGKKAREEVSGLLKKQADQIARLEAQLGGVGNTIQANSTERMLATMDDKMPEWRQLNTNEEFLSWLGLPDPLSGGIRHDMLKTAYSQGDASRVLAFFNGFLAQEAATAPALAKPDTVATPGKTTVAKVPLASLAAPGRAKMAASQPGPAEKPFISRADIAAFYTAVANGKYRGNATEQQRLEAMIVEAQADGRIR